MRSGGHYDPHRRKEKSDRFLLKNRKCESILYKDISLSQMSKFGYLRIN